MHFLPPALCAAIFFSHGFPLHLPYLTSERETTYRLIKDVMRILIRKLIWTIGSQVFSMFAGVLNFAADLVATCMCT